MMSSITDKVLVYLANDPMRMMRAKKDLRRARRIVGSQLGSEYLYGTKLLNGNAICGDRLLMFKGEGRILPYRECVEIRLEKNESHQVYRKVYVGRLLLRLFLWLLILAAVSALAWFIYGHFWGYDLKKINIGRYLLTLAAAVVVLIVPVVYAAANTGGSGYSGVDAGAAAGGVFLLALLWGEDIKCVERYTPTMYLKMRYASGGKKQDEVIPLRIQIPKDEQLREFHSYFVQRLNS